MDFVIIRIIFYGIFIIIFFQKLFVVELCILIIWISEECILSKFKFYEKNIEYCRLLLLIDNEQCLNFLGERILKRG